MVVLVKVRPVSLKNCAMLARSVGRRQSSPKTIEPTLKPYQPTHSRPAPIMVSGQVVRLHRLAAEADALADDQGEHQAGDTGVDVDRGSAGVVLRADLGADQRRAAEDHVGQREVGQRHPQRQEHHPGRELHAVGDRAADQRRGDDREGQLEHHVDVVVAA